MAAICAALAACGKSQDQPIRVAIIADPLAPFATGPMPGAAATLLRGATGEGLVSLDADGKVIPALADRWIVTDDGLSYILRMRDGTWADGARLTGESAKAALQRAIAAQAGTPLGVDLRAIEEVRATAGRVIEVRLSRPVPDMLLLLAQPELGLRHHDRGDGPMSLTREGTVALLQVIPPARLGMPAPEEAAASTRPLRFWALGGEAGVGAFAAGRVDALLGGTYVDWPRVGGAGIARASVRVDPVAGMFGLEVLHHEGLLAIAQNREAIAMSIDRAALAARMGLPAWVTTSRVVSPGLPGDSGQVGERWLDYDMENRHALAAPRIAAWVKLSGKPAHLRISMRAGPGSSLLTERLVIDLATIGITAEAVDEHAPADLKVVDVVARYQRNTWFFSQMSCTVRPAACNPDADALVLRGQAAAGSDAQALFAQAERAYADANDYVPLGLPIRWALAAPSLAGFAVNGWAYHPLRPLAGRLP